jgi:ketosteroid isomerase-like protein
MRSCSLALVLVAVLCFRPAGAVEEAARLTELNAYWAEVSRTVQAGDFQGYVATCHDEGVLVSGTNGKCHPLAQALARWKREFDATKAGTRTSSVSFRFSKRLGDETTAHESGIFLYSWSNAEGKVTNEYIHFEALLRKQPTGWKILMEYQKSKASVDEWDALR